MPKIATLYLDFPTSGTVTGFMTYKDEAQLNVRVEFGVRGNVGETKSLAEKHLRLCGRKILLWALDADGTHIVAYE